MTSDLDGRSVLDHSEAAILGALDLRRLRTLASIARHGSFSQAAHELHFTQSAVSQQISTLERDLGVTLLHRNPVALTEAGAALCARFEAAVAHLAAAHVELEAFRPGNARRIRIATASGLTSKLMVAAVEAAAKRALDVRVASLDPEASLAAVRRGDADVALTYAFDASQPKHDELEVTRLLRDHLTVALPADHAARGQQAVTLSSLAGERWIDVPSGGLPRELRGSTPNGGGQSRPRIESESFHHAQELVAAGLGIALVPMLEQRRDLAIAYVPVSGDQFKRCVYVAVPVAQASNAAVVDVLDALIATVAGLGGPAQVHQVRGPRGCDRDNCGARGVSRRP
jgi:DNA-binding transcriptional LysR family regulator